MEVATRLERFNPEVLDKRGKLGLQKRQRAQQKVCHK